MRILFTLILSLPFLTACTGGSSFQISDQSPNQMAAGGSTMNPLPSGTTTTTLPVVTTTTLPSVTTTTLPSGGGGATTTTTLPSVTTTTTPPTTTTTTFGASGQVNLAYNSSFYDPETSAWLGVPSSSALDFGSATVGDTAVAQMTFQVTNSTSGTVSLSALAVPTGFVIVSGFASSSLAAGATTTFMVSLDSSNAGSPSGSISFTSSAGGQNSVQVLGVVK
jgi:hypothetical protein